MKDYTNNYTESIGSRLNEIMIIIGLDIAGFAELFNKSTSHIYGIINGTRPLSESFAKEIGKTLGFEGSKIFNLNTKIPKFISKSNLLAEFKNTYKGNPEYFLNTKSERSIHTFISEVLIKSECFSDGPKYLNEIKTYCEFELNKKLATDQLSKALTYAVQINILRSDKKPIKLKNGKFGQRLVNVYDLKK